MSQRERRLTRIRARPAQADFADVQRVFEDFGWQVRKRSGSHVIFSKAGEGHFSVPTVGGRKVKGYILDQICVLLKLDEMDD